MDHDKQSATHAFKTVSKIAIEKTAEATCDLIGNRIADLVAKSYVDKLQVLHCKVIQRLLHKQIPKGRYISPEK